MAVAASLFYDTKLDTSGFQKGINSITNSARSGGNTVRSIVAGLGITKLISTAISTINGSIDGAISRVDTLNNFPKVMSNLGIGADEAKDSVNELSDKLTGLPTTLDSATASVQRFTSKNGNIKKSTSYFLALNNALLAGGASMDIQQSALEQLSQSYSKGKMDMEEWRSIQTAMPAQLNQIAQAMGMTSDALGEGLRDGTISMDDFMDKIVELNTEGVGQFASFEEQAKGATGGIATSITNLKTAVTRGVANVIDSLNKALESNNLPNISEMIQIASQKISDAFKKVSEVVKDIDFNKLIGDIKALAPYVIIATSAFWGYKSALTAVSIATKLLKFGSLIKTFVTLIPAVKSVKDAFLLLNMAFGLSPIGIIVAGIAALIAVFVLLWNKCEWFRNFWISLWEGIKKAFNKVVEFIKKNWKNIALFIINPFAGIFKILYDNVDGFREFVDKVVKNIKDFFKNLADSIVKFFTETIPNAITNFIEKAKDFVSKIPYYIGFVIGLIIGYIILFAQRLVEFVTVDIPNFINNVIQWFSELPGKIAEFISNVWEKIKELGVRFLEFITIDIPNFISGIIQWFSELPGKIWEALVNAYNKVVEWLSNLYNKCKQGITDVVNGIKQWFSELPDKMKEIGKNIVQGIWTGIKNAKDWLIGKIKDFAKGITDGIKKALGIKSPSRIMRDQVGQWIPKGIAVGIEANTDSIDNAIDDLNNNMINKLQKAVNMETGNINAKASLSSNAMYNSVIQINANFDGDVQMDSTRVGRVIAPSITKTIKVGGLK